MNEEEKYPDYVYGNTLGSPYWDIFEDGFEQGERQSEERIEELEKENAELKNRNQELLESCEGATMVYKDLQKANNNLTKAKEYIKFLLMNCVGVYESTGKTIAEIQAEAEQFISEVEK